MGIICELYRISDSEIEKLNKLNFEQAEEFLNENYASIHGKYHKENDIVFTMDKGWGITSYLIQELNNSKREILAKLNNKFIKSYNVKLINEIIKSIEIQDLESTYNKQKLIQNNVYRAKYEVNWHYINKYHLTLYKSAFKKASELNDGIAINYN